MSPYLQQSVAKNVSDSHHITLSIYKVQNKRRFQESTEITGKYLSLTKKGQL